MKCRICGEEGQWVSDCKQVLCAKCAENTPFKLSFNAFKDMMWTPAERAKWGDPSSHTEHMFYEDYLASTMTLSEYKGDVVDDDFVWIDELEK
jgi:hypothetical protein